MVDLPETCRVEEDRELIVVTPVTVGLATGKPRAGIRNSVNGMWFSLLVANLILD